ncbi:MAG: phosphate transport system protein [Thalassolituus oleivorans]|jgi:phosphate transport system protein
MFEWLSALRSQPSGLDEIMQYFEQMLEDGRHVFDAAANSLLGGTDPEVIKDDLWATDKRINSNERRIRRRLITHAAVHGRTEFPVCLALMSIVKDAERIGDFGKNIFDLSIMGAKISDAYKDDLVKLKDSTSRLLAKSRNIYETQNADDARAFIAECEQLQSHCESQLRELCMSTEGNVAATAMVYRYLKRVLAHSMNIITSVVMPLDRLDYYDEDENG